MKCRCYLLDIILKIYVIEEANIFRYACNIILDSKNLKI